MKSWRKGLIGASLVWLALVGCGSETAPPPLFLPKVLGPDGVDLDSRRSRLCHGTAVHLDDSFLTPENFGAIFDCANYDSSLEEVRPLLRSPLFPDFLRSMNLVLGADSTSNLRETLRGWLEEDSPGGTSRLDRLLPIAARVIKNPAFQAGLPVLDALLQQGGTVWASLLPSLGDIVYQDRFPDTWRDLVELFGATTSANPTEGEPADRAGKLKAWARFLGEKVDEETVAARTLALLHGLEKVRPAEGSLLEYFDHLNEKGVLEAIYLDNGRIRGETLDPKLNADPDEDELRDGTPRTPTEREEFAYRKLFARPASGEAPILQLAGIVAEFQKPHPDFLPALSRWFSANGARVTEGVSEYALRARVVEGLASLKTDTALLDFAKKSGRDAQAPVDRAAFSAFLTEALNTPAFSAWLGGKVHALNEEQLGVKNAAHLEASPLAAQVASLYANPALAAAGAAVVPEGGTLALTAAIRRFGNLQRGYELEVGGARATLENHLLDEWWSAVSAHVGEGIALDYVVKLAQSLVTEFTDDFSARNVTLAEWYFASPYGNPASTETLAGYAVKEFDALGKLRKHGAYLKGAFADEVFANEEDKAAFRLLVDQAPNLWIYLKSGMARSGNDLTRALASRDRGYLTRGYVSILVTAFESGWLRNAVRLVETYHQHFAPTASEPPGEELADRRRLSKGADALKRIARMLAEPAREGDYSTSTVGRLLVPLAPLVAPEGRERTEAFMLTGAREILNAEDRVLNDFFREFSLEAGGAVATVDSRATLRSVSELLKDPNFPRAVDQVSHFFREDAVKPALDFFARKVDDGSLPRVLLLLRRVLGFRG